ncbi:MAG: NAD(P)-dependent alcohol dehydrogenase [Bdellovibrionota bacterium]
MKPTLSYAAQNAKTPLAPFSFQRRDPKPHDVAIDILFCGVCHSDIHQARDEWGGSTFPMVPGHEIVGRVASTGSSVKKFKKGDLVGVGCFIDSCRTCSSCSEGLEQYCEKGMNATYNGVEKDSKTPTQGGYSDHIVVDENYVLSVPASMDLGAAAPLLCAGITTYSPLKHWGVGRGHKVGVVGLGGLGHMAVKLAKAMGAEVTVLSTSRKKEADSKRLGAQHFLATNEDKALENAAGTFDFLIDAVSAPHDYNAYLNTLKRDGTMILLGVPDQPAPVSAFSLIMKRRKLGGSLIGGIKETQEMLDFCAKHNIVSDVEIIPIQKINEAYERMIKGDVRYRFVIDMASLRQ